MLDDKISFETGGGGKPPVRRLEVLSGPGGRRRWTREAKSAIIEETLRHGANIADVAAATATALHKAGKQVLWTPPFVQCILAGLGGLIGKGLLTCLHRTRSLSAVVRLSRATIASLSSRGKLRFETMMPSDSALARYKCVVNQ